MGNSVWKKSSVRLVAVNHTRDLLMALGFTHTGQVHMRPLPTLTGFVSEFLLPLRSFSVGPTS